MSIEKLHNHLQARGERVVVIRFTNSDEGTARVVPGANLLDLPKLARKEGLVRTDALYAPLWRGGWPIATYHHELTPDGPRGVYLVAFAV